MAEICANCGAEIKSGLLSGNVCYGPDAIELINQGHGLSLVAGCGKCAQQLVDSAPFKLGNKVVAKRKSAESLLPCIALASIHSPPGCSFQTLGLVTAQSVSGTGLFSDVTSAFTDLFGAQSGAYNQKLRAAEELCRASLRAQVFQMGGQAIVGVDVDYAEVGGQRAMLMVCMTGTAVKIDDPAMIGDQFAADYAALLVEIEELNALSATAKRLGVTVAQ